MKTSTTPNQTPHRVQWFAPWTWNRWAIVFVLSGLIISGPPISVVALATFLYFNDPFDDRLFDREIWLKSSDQERAAMARDVVKHHIQSGMSFDQIQALLGSTDLKAGGKRDPWGKPMPGSKVAAYYLGSWSAYRGMDDAVLYVYFDTANLVISAQISGG